MANDDLNFNFDEFIAAHSQSGGAPKPPPSPKKKKAQAQAARRPSAQTENQTSDDILNSILLGQEPASVKAQKPEARHHSEVHAAPRREHRELPRTTEPESKQITENIQPEKPLPDEKQLETEAKRKRFNQYAEKNKLDIGETSSDIWLHAHKAAPIPDTIKEGTGILIVPTAEEEAAFVAAMANPGEAKKPEESAPAKQKEQEKTLPPASLPQSRKKVSGNTLTNVMAIPKYKDKTSDIVIPKQRISDTAAVEVGTRHKNPPQNLLPQDSPPQEEFSAVIDDPFTKPKFPEEDGTAKTLPTTAEPVGEAPLIVEAESIAEAESVTEETQSEEEKAFAERMKREQELTERILRAAYANEQKEQQRSEKGKSEEESESTAEEARLSKKEEAQKRKQEKKDASKKATKIKKVKKAEKKAAEKKRALPVVQVGGGEDNSQSIIDVLENALDEDVIELEYVSKSPSEEHEYHPRGKKKSRTQTLYFLIGLFFTVMSIIGIVVSVKTTVKYVRSISDDSKQKSEFAEFVYPIVITDPAAFGSVNDLSDEVIIKSAIWDIIMYDDTDKYEHDDAGNMYVPYIQVENHAKAIFGTTNIVHGTTVFSAELTFYYDSDAKLYKVPVAPQLFPNTPVVEEIEKAGEKYTLTVAYQKPAPTWAMLDSEFKPDVIKRMKYVLTKYNDGYTVISILNCE